MSACQKDGQSQFFADGDIMNELLTLLIVVAVWFFVQWWLLPKLGIST
jgi:hypothetical protein